MKQDYKDYGILRNSFYPRNLLDLCNPFNSFVFLFFVSFVIFVVQAFIPPKTE